MRGVRGAYPRRRGGVGGQAQTARCYRAGNHMGLPRMRGDAVVTDPLTAQLAQLIRAGDQLRPRSRQKKIGPSSVGAPCDRRLAYQWIGHPHANSSDPLAAIIGTGFHQWAADAFARLNGVLGRERYLIEEQVTIRPGLSGTLDLYDQDARRLIDWKCVGANTIKTTKRDGPRPQYVIQSHLYGMGLEAAGHTPSEVALAFVPRGGFLSGLHVWTAPYDRAVAEQALTRLDDLALKLTALDVETHPQRWVDIPISPGHECVFCPWYTPNRTDLSVGCPGDVLADATSRVQTKLGGEAIA